MPLPNLSVEVDRALQEMQLPDSQRRLAALKRLEQMHVTSAQILAALQYMAVNDPDPQVRKAARNGLKKRGSAPASTANRAVAPSNVSPAQPMHPAVKIILIVLLVIFSCLCVAILTIAILAILGPQIGGVFSRVTDGLSGT